MVFPQFIHLLLFLLQGSHGKVYPLPEFAKSQSAAAAAGSEGGGAAAAAAADDSSFLVVWEVQAEEGVGPVLLLARAAHCLQQLHTANVGRQAVADSEYWQVGYAGSNASLSRVSWVARQQCSLLLKHAA
jgi:hypothetical protein